MYVKNMKGIGCTKPGEGKSTNAGGHRHDSSWVKGTDTGAVRMMCVVEEQSYDQLAHAQDDIAKMTATGIHECDYLDKEDRVFRAPQLSVLGAWACT